MSRHHACPVCGTEYDAHQQAAACERRCDDETPTWSPAW